MDIANFRRLLEINPGRGINRSDNPKIYEKDEYYTSYRELNSGVSDAVSLETQGIILQLLARFVSSPQFRPADSTTMPSNIQESISYIQRNIRDDLTVGKLAKRANLHQDYFSRLFLRYTGERPLSFIHIKRIELAQYLMATTKLSYAQIADAAGFENLPYFSKIFKKVTSITQGEYRKRNDWV
jgi:AraC-like DNA-binding protein